MPRQVGETRVLELEAAPPGNDFFRRASGKRKSRWENFLDSLRFDSEGLVPVVVEDAGSEAMLMVAHADRIAVTLSLATGEMYYFSRTRRRLWREGETSGTVQSLTELRTNWSGGTLLARVRCLKSGKSTGAGGEYPNGKSP